MVGCSAPTTADDADTQEAAYSTAPLSGAELAFEGFMHVDHSTNGWAAHDYMGYSEYATTDEGKRISLSVHLYLERDRSFTLYYSELEMVSQYGGRPRTERKLTGEWRANGTTLELGTASASLARVSDGWGSEVDGLDLVLPAGWQTSDVSNVLLGLHLTGSNVGPKAPFFEDYQ